MFAFLLTLCVMRLDSVNEARGQVGMKLDERPDAKLRSRSECRRHVHQDAGMHACAHASRCIGPHVCTSKSEPVGAPPAVARLFPRVDQHSFLPKSRNTVFGFARERAVALHCDDRRDFDARRVPVFQFDCQRCARSILIGLPLPDACMRV